MTGSSRKHPAFIVLLLLVPNSIAANISHVNCDLVPLAEDPCSFLHANPACGEEDTFIAYEYLYYCHLRDVSPLVLWPMSVLWLILLIHWLAIAADGYFVPTMEEIVAILNIRPSVAAVTFLAMGNGGPDIFAAVAAFSSELTSKVGLGAAVGQGLFASSVILGLVAWCSPKPVVAHPRSLMRDVVFYFASLATLGWFVARGSITSFDSVILMSIYAVYVAVVVGTDTSEKSPQGYAVVMIDMGHHSEESPESCDVNEGSAPLLDNWIHKVKSSRKLSQVLSVLSIPITVLMTITIPMTTKEHWHWWIGVASLTASPVAIIVLFHLGGVWIAHEVPLLAVFPAIGLMLSFVARSRFSQEAPPAKRWRAVLVALAFATSIVWMYSLADELVNVLAVMGSAVGVPPGVMGLTVLAVGQASTDLVANVSLARAGHGKLAMGGCFAGPMFGILWGIGAGLLIQTLQSHVSYEVEFHMALILALFFGCLSLVVTVVAMTVTQFHLTRAVGALQFAVYLLFAAAGILSYFHLLFSSKPI